MWRRGPLTRRSMWRTMSREPPEYTPANIYLWHLITLQSETMAHISINLQSLMINQGDSRALLQTPQAL